MRIVVIDPHTIHRLELCNLINNFSPSWQIVAVAEDGYEGMKLIEDFMPDVVITDILLPRISGADMIRNIQSKGISACFIVLSSSREFSHVQECLSLGVYRYLTNPVDSKGLCEVLNRAETETKPSATYSGAWRPAELDENKYGYLVNRMLSIIHNQYSKHLLLDELALKYRVTPEYLSTLFKKSTGYCFSDYLKSYRIEKAMEIIQNRNKKVYEIAYLVGYHDTSYFCRVFKNTTGITVSQYIRSLAL